MAAAIKIPAECLPTFGSSEETGRPHVEIYKGGGLQVSEARRLKQLEDENRRLKKLVADLSLDKEALQDVLSRKW